jgi:hypothetical protein
LCYTSHMAITRSGLKAAIQAKCIQPLSEADYSCETGKVYDVITEMTAMLMIRTESGKEILVPKYAFEMITTPKSQD